MRELVPDHIGERGRRQCTRTHRELLQARLHFGRLERAVDRVVDARDHIGRRLRGGEKTEPRFGDDALVALLDERRHVGQEAGALATGDRERADLAVLVQNLELARLLEPEARRLRKEYEDGPEAALNAAKPKLAEARFAVHGPGEPPDATFTLRLSYGQVKGYEDDRGKEIPYATTIGGAFKRATGELPYVLPPSWLKAKNSLNADLPFDFVSTSDIIGGNSGSPTVNARGEIVGIVFDMNIEALPDHFEYSETQARAVHVASQAVVEALRKIYRADRILGEIGQ